MHFAFVRLGAYPLLNPSCLGPIGGAETRAIIFARGLSQLGRHRISLVVGDEGQPDCEMFHGMEVVPRRDLRIRLIRRVRGYPTATRNCIGSAFSLLLAKIFSLAAHCLPRHPPSPMPRARAHPVYRQIAADVCVGFGNNWATAEAIASCKLYGGKSVLFLASNVDLADVLVEGRPIRLDYGEYASLGHYALHQADWIFAQTAYQSLVLKERFGRDSVVIRNPIDLCDTEIGPAPSRDNYLLWVGRLDIHKGPETFMELARLCPEVSFKAILTDGDAPACRQFLTHRPSNVEVMAPQSHAGIAYLLRRASAFVSTSPATSEGFPNMILEAGKYACPVLSFAVDPDGFMTEHACGLVAGGNLLRLADMIRRMKLGEFDTVGMSRRMREYLERRHSLDDRVAELQCALEECYACGKRT